MGMKLTFNVDGELLERVVRQTGARTKTEAIQIALREIDRRGRLVEVLREGCGIGPEDLRHLFAPAAPPAEWQVAEGGAAEGKATR